MSHEIQYPVVYPTIVDPSKPFKDNIGKFPYTESQIGQAVPLENSQKKGYSPVFRNKASKDGLFNAVHPDAHTIYHAFQNVLDHNAKNEFLGRRKKLDDGTFGEYEFETYKEIGVKRDYVGSGIHYNLKTHFPDVDIKDVIVCLYSGNTYEWILTDLACHAYGFPNTTLYESLGPDSSKHILSLTETPVLVLSKSKIEHILKLGKFNLKLLVSMDEFDTEEEQQKLVEQAKELGIKLITFKELMQDGKDHLEPHIPPKRDDIATISFTSGTSGMPKGVEINHEAFISGVTFCFCHVEYPPNPRAASFSFLPLAHVLERFKVAFEITAGAKVGLPHDATNVKGFLGDIKVFRRSSHLCAVPRVYSKIEQGLRAKFKLLTGIKGLIIRSVVAFKLWWDYTWGANGRGIINSIIKYLFLSKIRQEIGFGNLDFLISGGAPINENAIKYLRSCFGCAFYVGYGLSETFAAVTLTNKFETNLKSTGPIGITTELRLRGVEELGYSWDKNRSGEILLRGPQVFRKYFKDPQKTAEAFDKDGWFLTGDVGRLDKDGKLEVIDRVKNFFKLSQGEYIAVEKIENIYLSTCEFMEQIFVYGNSFKDHLVAIIGVVPEAILKIIVRNASIDVSTPTQFDTVEKITKALESKDDVLRGWLLKKSNEEIKSSGLFGFEKIRNAYFLIDPLNIENDCMTPTLKLKRAKAQAFYNDAINDLYAESEK